MAIPNIRKTYLDNNLGMNVAKPTKGKVVLLIGTAEDGPDNTMVYVADADTGEQIFGQVSQGTLTRGIYEIFSVPGNKQVYAMRIGNGNKAFLALREQTMYSGMRTATSTSTADSAVALRIDARYPGSIYNGATLGLEILEDVGTVLVFYNPKTQQSVYFRFSTDPDDTSVYIHNVYELAIAMNSDPNISPWYIVTANQINSSFECWVLPITSDSDYGTTVTTGTRDTWDTLMEQSKLPIEWSQGWSYDGSVAQFSLRDRIVDTGTSTDTLIEHPDSSPIGYEVLTKGFISGTYPNRAFETSVNNIISFNKLYSLSYTGTTLFSSAKTFSLPSRAHNTRGNRGYTFGALNGYKADGLKLKRPNASPVNEISDSERIETWASEYCMMKVNKVSDDIYVGKAITNGAVGTDNTGYIEYNSYLPIDLSPWPLYYGTVLYEHEEHPTDNIIIGNFLHTSQTSSVFKVTTLDPIPTDIGDVYYTGLKMLKFYNEEKVGVYTRYEDSFMTYPSADVTDGSLIIKIGTVSGEDLCVIPAVTRNNRYYRIFDATGQTNEFYRLPAYNMVRNTTGGVTRAYPYTSMAVNTGTHTDVVTVDSCYYTTSNRLPVDNYAYYGYFMGPLSRFYDYTPVCYKYDLDPTTGEILDIETKHTLAANKYDISFALVNDGTESTDTTNALTYELMIGSNSNVFNLDADESIDRSARAYVHPISTDFTRTGTISDPIADGYVIHNVTVSVTPADPDATPPVDYAIVIEDESGAPITPIDGDVLVLNGHVIVLNPDGSLGTTLTIPEYPKEIVDVEGLLIVYRGDIPTSHYVSQNANLLHFAEIIAMEGFENYRFVENYDKLKRRMITQFEFSLDGRTWETLEPQYISQILWTDNGQTNPNDSAIFNKMRIDFIGNRPLDLDGTSIVNRIQGLENGAINDIFNLWAWMWYKEVATDPSIKISYASLSDFFDNWSGLSATPTKRYMSTDDWSDFISWAGNTVPPFMTISEDGSQLVIKPNVQIRAIYNTTKGLMRQTPTSSGVSSIGRADNYFISGSNVSIGAPMPDPFNVSYLTEIDYELDTDYTFDTNGIITFTNPDKMPFGSEYSPFNRFLLGFDFQYNPEWIDLAATVNLHGGTNGNRINGTDKVNALKTVLPIIEMNPPDILVPIDFFIDETIQSPSPETGELIPRNSGVARTLAAWLNKVNGNEWTTSCVLPLSLPRNTTEKGLISWRDRAVTANSADYTQAGTVMATLDSFWIDVVASAAMVFTDGGWGTTMQCMYAGMLASHNLPDNLVNAAIPSAFTPALPFQKAFATPLSQDDNFVARYITCIQSDIPGATRFVISDFVTCASKSSDYTRGIRREIMRTVANLTKEVWNEYKGKIASQQWFTSFQTALERQYNMIPAIKSIRYKVDQSTSQRINSEISVTVNVVPFGEAITLQLTLGFQRD